MEEGGAEPSALFERIATLLEREQGYPRERISTATRLAEDAGMDGDDVGEFLDAYRREFGMELTGFKFYHHFGPEGCNPFWLIVRPWWQRIERMPITVQDLVEAARAGRWLMQYPDEPRYRDRGV